MSRFADGHRAGTCERDLASRRPVQKNERSSLEAAFPGWQLDRQSCLEVTEMKHNMTNLKQAMALSCALVTGALLMMNNRVTGQEGGTTTVSSDTVSADSAMIRPWDGPYGGVPPWNLVRPDEFVAAFETAIAMAQADIDAITANPEAPTFQNTIVALEDAGRALTRLGNMFGVHASSLNVGPMPDVQKVVMPRLAEYEDSVRQNKQLFGRVAAVYEGDELSQLSPAEQRLVDDHYKDFVRNGAKLNDDDKRKLSQINQRLATLFADFSQNVLDDEQDYVTWIDNEADLDGLPESIVAAMANAAKERDNGRQMGRHQYAFVNGAVPDLRQQSQVARKGLAHLLQPRRQRRRAR